MNLTRRFFAVSAALLLVAPLGVAAQKKPAVDWTKTVVATSEGGFRMGNPKAPVKLVEYGSLTCPHCKHFAESGMTPLKAYVRTGKVSFEYRNYVLNGIDLAATLVARCGGAARFFPAIDKFYATQNQWVAKISGMPDAEKEKIRALAEGPRLDRLATIGGMKALAAPLGITPAQSTKCLSDPAGLKRVLGMVEAGQAFGVQGTPTFFVNGSRVNAGDWPSLEPHIKSAGG